MVFFAVMNRIVDMIKWSMQFIMAYYDFVKRSEYQEQEYKDFIRLLF